MAEYREGATSETVNECFTPEGRQDIPADLRREALEHTNVLAALSDPEREAITFFCQFWSLDWTTRLLNDESLATDPTEFARLQGKRRGMEILADELSNPGAIEETAKWLKSDPTIG